MKKLIPKVSILIEDTAASTGRTKSQKMRGFQVQSVKRVFTRLNAQPIRARTSRAAAVPLARGLGARLNVHTYCNSVKIVKQQMRCTMKVNEWIRTCCLLLLLNVLMMM